MTRIADVVELTFGFAFKSAEFTNSSDGIRLLRGDNVAQGNLRWAGAKRFPATRADEVDRYFLSAGDLVIAMDRPWIGAGLKYAVVREQDLPSLLVQRVARLRTKSDSLDQRFLSAIIGSAAFTNYVIGVQTGSAVPHISGGQIGDFEFNLPPIEEQRAIAATLGALDDKIESNRRAIALSESLARSLFEKRFDLTQFSDGTALSELINVNPRRVLKAGTPSTYVGMSSLPEFSAEVYGWETKEAGSGQRFIAGDVLMARITPCLENGKTAVVDMLQDGEVGWGSTEYVVLSPAERFSTAWIYCLVRDERIREFAIQSMTGTSGRQRFQADRFSQYRIAEPDEQDLVAFNAVAEPLFARMTQLRDESLCLSALRDALLPGLLSGRVRAAGVEATP